MSASRQYVELLLTCASEAEADRIAEALLAKRLITCAKKAPVAARYWWQGELEQGSEILLMMESAADLFDRVEAEVAKLHSYDTFVLQAVAFERVSTKAQAWMSETLVDADKGARS